MAVREVHGVTENGYIGVSVHERAGDITIRLHGYQTRHVTVDEARHLASKLYRLARRIEKRQAE